MVAVVSQNVVGKDVKPPVELDRRRRRLSTLVANHAPKDRAFIVSVHRQGDSRRPDDNTVRLRAQWKDTFVSRDDAVLITYLPLGGGSNAGSSGVGGKQVGMALAMVALAIAAPGIGTGIAGVLGGGAILGQAISAGIIIGNIWSLS
jgi:hypothetical protein